MFMFVNENYFKELKHLHDFCYNQHTNSYQSYQNDYYNIKEMKLDLNINYGSPMKNFIESFKNILKDII
ncbi:MAG: hypothetical protein N2043_01415 [Ignavibacterium sp.]|nr:hypothetical protein [Ignavibacterium sp.]